MIENLSRVVTNYLTTRFPIVSQGTTVLSAFACSYLVYGQVHGEQVFGWGTVVGAATAVLLALTRRIIDDVEDTREDVLAGKMQPLDGRRQTKGLLCGAAVVTALSAALNATSSPLMLAVALAIPVWFSIATVLKHTVTDRVGIVFYVINESCPAVGLLYPYVAWHTVSGNSVPPLVVGATVGLFWTTYQFWNFTRKAGGPEGWPPWGLSMQQTRVALLAFLTAASLFSVVLAISGHLSTLYLFYGPLLSLAFAAVILRWWSRLPARDPERVAAPWAGSGLSFAATVELGLLIGVLASSLG